MYFCEKTMFLNSNITYIMLYLAITELMSQNFVIQMLILKICLELKKNIFTQHIVIVHLALLCTTFRTVSLY